jgi:hypothetical protein
LILSALPQRKEISISEPRRRARARTASQGAPDSNKPAPKQTDQWYRADLHIHTPGSIDYQDPGIRPIDLLRTAAEQSLDIIALTDHNSVAGWTRLKHEIEDLTYLERLGRISDNESALLAEYRDLMSKVLVLPGFEFTATFGFHILAIFDPSTSTRMMEHLLLSLGIPEDRFGSGEVGATSDVLKAYEVLAEHGALVIGAHVNSTHGVAMRNIRFGGQTKIAYTQDENLHALEVTDLTSTSTRSTARFFSGTKAEYPRRMHCVQGSDAHRLKQDPARSTNLGIGDRVTEFLLPEKSFAALKAVLLSEDWDRVRPARSGGPQAAAVHAARETGPSQSIIFFERVQGAAKQSVGAVVRDVVALANGGGGTIYLGVGPASRRTVPGLPDADQLQGELATAFREQIEPPLAPEIEPITYENKPILAINVSAGSERPYALATGEILVRRGEESAPARRDEIVRMVRGEAVSDQPQPAPEMSVMPAPQQTAAAPERPKQERQDRQQPRSRQQRPQRQEKPSDSGERSAPRNGVEIVEVSDQDGIPHYTMRDLRNDQITRNVTAQTARSLWAQAIREFEKGVPSEDRVTWDGDVGFWKSVRISNGERRYHLVAREPDGSMRLFFGVSEDGLDDHWKAVLPASSQPQQETTEAPIPA